MGTIIIKNISSLTEAAVLIRVAYYIAGNEADATQGGIVIQETQRNDTAMVRQFIVYEE